MHFFHRQSRIQLCFVHYLTPPCLLGYFNNTRLLQVRQHKSV
nr:MAG TPA: hypothetical protein [Caudoviricetes sp.]